MRRTTAVLALSGIMAIVPVAAQAARGGGTGGSLSIPNGTYGTSVVATVANAPASTWVVASCYQNGLEVIFNRVALDSNGQATLQLGPTSNYQSGIGGASCNAEAKSWNAKRQRWVPVATTTFTVSD